MRRLLEIATASSVLTPALLAHQHSGMSQSEEASEWEPEFFSAEQNDSLIALGERIIPGTAAAQCNRLIDRILTIDSQKNRDELIQALAAFDSHSVRQYQQPFRLLTPSQQNQLLIAASNGEGSLHTPFTVVKEWMADAYWSSSQGLRELGSTGRVAWSVFPGCGSPQPHN